MEARVRFSPFAFTILTSFFLLNVSYSELSVPYQVCFTPQENCTSLLIHQIEQSTQSIYVQAYSFTSYKIARALIDAYARGVDVKLILDSSDFDTKNFSQESFFKASGIPIWKDYQMHIAHNKVMIFDESTVETGSFNYTTSAQKFNAENMLIINDKALTGSYLKNWKSRQALSLKV